MDQFHRHGRILKGVVMAVLPDEGKEGGSQEEIISGGRLRGSSQGVVSGGRLRGVVSGGRLRGL